MKDGRTPGAALLGLLLGPVMALLTHQLLSATATELPDSGQIAAGVAVWMATWWMTEAVPLPVTSLLPLILFPLCCKHSGFPKRTLPCPGWARFELKDASSD